MLRTHVDGLPCSTSTMTYYLGLIATINLHIKQKLINFAKGEGWSEPQGSPPPPPTHTHRGFHTEGGTLGFSPIMSNTIIFGDTKGY